MQLPRGTFREIRKSVAIESLLHELERERFSGVANISSLNLNATLVFKGGKCILVKVQNFRGDAGWDEIQKATGEEVDAALSLLGDAQVELALEFNKPCRVLKSGRQPPAAHRPVPAASHEIPGSAMPQKGTAPVAPLKPPVKPAPTHHRATPPQTSTQAPVHAPAPHPHLFPRASAPVPPSPPVPAVPHENTGRPAAEEPPEKEPETSTFETDLDTFDTMDFDNVTDKIRTDCKTMIKQLHLDHLMER